MMKLDIQMFADGKVVIDTELNTKNFENGLSKMQSTSQKAGSSIKNIVAGLGLTKLIGTAMKQISSSIDGAVKRVDTLNNFPKVMSNLGIGAKEAEASIKKMSDKLTGLPTTLDQGAAAVQRFTSSNGNVKKSTDIFLALNNAILAGGASADIQASALEQLSQAYAKGKPDMMEWRTAMTAMPAQLKQVAIAMGYVNADELGEALRNGTVSMDEFMDKISELNVKGVNGFQSFEQQARNSTGGIATSITVAKTQVVKGVADIITSLNKGLEDANLPSISELITLAGQKAKEALDIVAKYLPKAIVLLKEMTPYLIAIGVIVASWKIGFAIQEIVVGFQKASLQAALYAMEVGKVSAAQVIFNRNLSSTEKAFALLRGTKISEVFSNIGNKAKSGASGVLSFLSAHKGLAIGLGAAGLAIGGIAALYKKSGGDADKMASMITNKINDIVNVIQNITSKLPEIINNVLPKIIQTITTVIPQIITTITNVLPTLIPAVINGVVSIISAIVAAIPKLIPPLIQGLVQITMALVNAFPTLIPALIDGAVQIIMAIVNALPTIIEALISALPTIIIAIVDGLLKALPLLVEGAIQLVFGLVRAIPVIIKTLILEMPKIVSQLAKALLNGYKYLFNTGIDLVKYLWNGFKSWVGTFFSNAVAFAKSIPGKIKSGIGSVVSIGKNLVQGIWNGISNAKDWVLSKIQGFGKSIVNGIKGIFGIKSPSTVMRDEVGKYLAQGVGVGFEDELDNVYRDMQQAIDLETGKMSADVQSSGTYQMAMAGLPTFNLLDNTQNKTQLVVNGKVLAEVVNTENRNREVASQ